MRRGTIGVVFLLILACGAVEVPAEAQQAGKMYRIGLLGWSTQAFYQPFIEVFLNALREYGWVEGQNIIIEARYADRKADRLSAMVDDLARLDLDVIVTITTTATRATMQVIKTTPIVFMVVADPVTSGFVAGLAHPGGNATGPSMMVPELAGKRLELLKEVVPEISRVAVFWEPTNPGVTLHFHQTRRDAHTLGLTLQSLEVRSRDDFEPAFAAMTRDRPDALVALIAPLTVRYTKPIVEFARKHRLPTMSAWKDFPRAGGLMSYAPNFADNFRRAAPYVHKILRGAKPADLPVSQPTQFELVINLKTAKALGLSIPPTLLLQANEVIR
jgi:putative ABC transport system substrate-binding protein